MKKSIYAVLIYAVLPWFAGQALADDDDRHGYEDRHGRYEKHDDDDKHREYKERKNKRHRMKGDKFGKHWEKRNAKMAKMLALTEEQQPLFERYTQQLKALHEEKKQYMENLKAQDGARNGDMTLPQAVAKEKEMRAYRMAQHDKRSQLTLEFYNSLTDEQKAIMDKKLHKRMRMKKKNGKYKRGESRGSKRSDDY